MIAHLSEISTQKNFLRILVFLILF